MRVNYLTGSLLCNAYHFINESQAKTKLLCGHKYLRKGKGKENRKGKVVSSSLGVRGYKVVL